LDDSSAGAGDLSGDFGGASRDEGISISTIIRVSKVMNILQDVKERFLTFETVKGAYLLPAGGVICYATLFYLQYVIQAFCLALGVYMMVKGFRKIQVNRVKQSLATERLKEAQAREMEIKATVQAVEETLRAGDSDDLSPVG